MFTLRTEEARTEQQDWKDAGVMHERTDASWEPTESSERVRNRLRLRSSVTNNGPLGTVMLREERVDISGAHSECTEGVREPTERLRLRSSVASLGPLGIVTGREEYTDLSGVNVECAEGVRVPAERLLLRSSVESNGPCGTVSLKDGVWLADRAECTESDLTDRSGVPAAGVRRPTEWLRLRASVASLGPFGNVSGRVS